MRIAQVVPLAVRVPPKKYGGTERVVHALTEELVRRGHDVTLFASGDSITSAKLDSTFPIHLLETKVRPLFYPNAPLLHSIGHAYSKSSEFDIIHDHTGYVGLPFAQISPTPTVFTLHDRIRPIEVAMFREFQKPHLISISKDQRKDHEGFNSAGTVYHGLSMEHYPFSNEHDGYLLSVGRICIEKGTHLAILLAKRLSLPLIIAAKIEETESGHRYFRKYVKPYLGGSISWVGEVDETERNKLMSRAMAFLNPGTWREPFGLTLIEAMACGAPVIGFNKGSIPELIEHGKTGFVVNTIDGMTQAVADLGYIDRAYCRSYALNRFNAERMTADYEKIYYEIVQKQSRFIIKSSQKASLQKPNWV